MHAVGLGHEETDALFFCVLSFLQGLIDDSAFLLFSGRQRSFIVDQESLGRQGEVQDDAMAQQLVHSRMLKDVTTSDYGTYDPTPSMEKPHFKLIPN